MSRQYILLVLLLVPTVVFADNNTTGMANITYLRHNINIEVFGIISNITEWCKDPTLETIELIEVQLHCSYEKDKNACYCWVRLPTNEAPQAVMALKEVEKRWAAVDAQKTKALNDKDFWLMLVNVYIIMTLIAYLYVAKVWVKTSRF